MAEERAQRRLAAIMAADAAGYSRLMGQDEEGTLATLKSPQRRQWEEPYLRPVHGRNAAAAG